MKIKILKSFTLGAFSPAVGSVKEIADETALPLINAGLAEKYTLVEPTGTLEIEKNGTYDVSAYKLITVNLKQNNLTPLEKGQIIRGIKFDTSKNPDLSQITYVDEDFATFPYVEIMRSRRADGVHGMTLYAFNLGMFTGNEENGYAILLEGDTNEDGIDMYCIYSDNDVTINIDGDFYLPKGWNTSVLDENGVYKHSEDGIVAELRQSKVWNGTVLGAFEAINMPKDEPTLIPFEIEKKNVKGIQVNTTALSDEELRRLVEVWAKNTEDDLISIRGDKHICALSQETDNTKVNVLLVNGDGTDEGFGVVYIDRDATLSDYGITYKKGWFILPDEDSLSKPDTLLSASGVVNVYCHKNEPPTYVKTIADFFKPYNGHLVGAIVGEEVPEPTQSLTSLQEGQSITGYKFDTTKTPDFSSLEFPTEGFISLFEATDMFNESEVEAPLIIGDLAVLTEGAISGKAIYAEGDQLIYSDVDYTNADMELSISQGWNTSVLDENGVFKLDSIYNVKTVNNSLPVQWNGELIGAVVHESNGTILKDISLINSTFGNTTQGVCVVDNPLMNETNERIKPRTLYCELSVNGQNKSLPLIYEDAVNNPIYQGMYELDDGTDCAFGIILKCDGLDENVQPTFNPSKAILVSTINGGKRSAEVTLSSVSQPTLNKLQTGDGINGVKIDTTPYIIKYFANLNFETQGDETASKLAKSNNGYLYVIRFEKQNGGYGYGLVNELDGTKDPVEFVYLSDDFYENGELVATQGFKTSENVFANSVTIEEIYDEWIWNGVFIGKIEA